MSNSPVTAPPPFSEDSQMWDDLKQVIASSSGFQRWQLEHSADTGLWNLSLERRVRCYLRETLETLAY